MSRIVVQARHTNYIQLAEKVDLLALFKQCVKPLASFFLPASGGGSGQMSAFSTPKDNVLRSSKVFTYCRLSIKLAVTKCSYVSHAEGYCQIIKTFVTWLGLS